jgi:hypothetical protein
VTFDIEIQLEAMENNHDELKSTQDQIIQEHKHMSTMMEETLAFMKSIVTIQGNLPTLEEKEKSNGIAYEQLDDGNLGTLVSWNTSLIREVEINYEALKDVDFRYDFNES